MELCDKADDAFARNKQCDDVSKWRRSRDILAVIRPLKRSNDDPLPKRRNEIVQCYSAWKHRNRRVIDKNVIEEYKKEKKKDKDETSNLRRNMATNDAINDNIVHIKTENVEGETEM